MRDGPKTLQHDSAGLETCFVVSVWERTHEPCLTRLAAGSVPSFPGRPSRSCRNTSWPSWGAGASGPSVGAGQLLWASSSPSEGPSLHDLSGHAPPGKPVGSYSPVSKPCLSGVFSIKKVLPFKDECIDTEATGWLFPSALWATVGRWCWSPSPRVSHGTWSEEHGSPSICSALYHRCLRGIRLHFGTFQLCQRLVYLQLVNNRHSLGIKRVHWNKPVNTQLDEVRAGWFVVVPTSVPLFYDKIA